MVIEKDLNEVRRMTKNDSPGNLYNINVINLHTTFPGEKVASELIINVAVKFTKKNLKAN